MTFTKPFYAFMDEKQLRFEEHNKKEASAK